MAPRRRQSQQQSGGDGQVYGPRSALTSFLREQGITGPNANINYANRRRGQLAQPSPPSPSGSTTPTTSVQLTAADDSTTSSSTGTGTSTPVTVTTASNDANAEAGPSSSSTAGKKRKSTSSAASKKKAKKDKAADDEDGFTLAGAPHAAPKKGRYDDRMPGAIAVCAECGKKFTVSKYTASNPRGPGLLCSPCTSESIEDRASFPSLPKKPKLVKKKSQKGVEETMYTPVPALQQACLSIIGSYIDDVEALGDIGHKNLDRVAKIVCKNRALNGDNLRLFLEVGHRELRLYDCTNVKDTALASIATFCPHLERLTLNLCGRLDDDVIDAWMKGFKELRHVTLYAPYLVTIKKWIEFLSTCGTDRPEFETFQLRMSSRFNDDCLDALVSHSPNLTHLQLAELGRFTSSSLDKLHSLKDLVSLDIARVGTPQGQTLQDDAVIALLANVGGNLARLVLDGNEKLTDKTLVEGIRLHCPALRELSLSNLTDVETSGVEALFTPPSPDPDSNAPTTPFSAAGLTLLNLHRVSSLSPSALELVLTHSGRTLKHLNLHSCDDLTSDVLIDKLATSCPELEVVDLSFVRSVDNFVVKALLEGCPKLRVLFLHGNNRVTSDVPRKAGVQLCGLENAVHSEIPSGVMWA
ncbi:DNA dependent ATPase [Rhodotorula toruloides]|uniref:DNA dependent ATPase n=1 Tax=Rhodotorula toruloides TaxID=5286 RepID=A0A511KJF0_RHOTO|nr:DNA dependent ATPase [Rhodotorula toruloides]